MSAVNIRPYTESSLAERNAEIRHKKIIFYATTAFLAIAIISGLGANLALFLSIGSHASLLQIPGLVTSLTGLTIGTTGFVYSCLQDKK